MTPRTELLNELTDRVNQGVPVSFTKEGDGERFCMAGEVGENCDGHPYSPALGDKLREAFAFLETRPDVHVIQWEDQERYQALIHHEGWDLLETKRFWTAVRESSQRKFFVGPERLADAAQALRAQYIIVPLVNAFGAYVTIHNRLVWESAPGSIFIFSAGMPSKVWIADVLRACPQVSCIDAGSAFDNLFVGNTRVGQVPMDQVRSLYHDWGWEPVHAVIFSKDRAMQVDALLRSMRKYAPTFWAPTILWTASTPQALESYEQLIPEYPKCRWVKETREPSFAAELVRCLETYRTLGALFSDDDVFFREVPRFEISAGESFSLRFGGGAAGASEAAAVASATMKAGGQPCLGWSADGNVHPIGELRGAVCRANPREPNLIEPVMNQPALAVREKRAERQSLVSIPHNLVQHVFQNPNMGGSAAELTERYLAGERIDLEAMDFSGVAHSHENIPYVFRQALIP